MPDLPTGADIPVGPTLETAMDRMRRAANFLDNGAAFARTGDLASAPTTIDLYLRTAEDMIAEARRALRDYLTAAVPISDMLDRNIAHVDEQIAMGAPGPADLPNDCGCPDREAIVTPTGLVCGTCGKIIDPRFGA